MQSICGFLLQLLPVFMSTVIVFDFLNVWKKFLTHMTHSRGAVLKLRAQFQKYDTKRIRSSGYSYSTIGNINSYCSSASSLSLPTQYEDTIRRQYTGQLTATALQKNTGATAALLSSSLLIYNRQIANAWAQQTQRSSNQTTIYNAMRLTREEQREYKY